MQNTPHHPDPHSSPKGAAPSLRAGGGELPTASGSPESTSLILSFPLFNPDPSIADAILRDLGDPDHTFRGIAEEHGTTLEALSAWFARPDIAERTSQIESAISRRARFVAIASLTTGAKAMQASISEYLLAAKIREEEPTDDDIYPSQKRAELIRRQAETARKATLVLLRIAKFDPAPRVARRSEPGRCASPSAKNHAPTPRPVRTLESLLTELADIAPDLLNASSPVEAQVGVPPLQISEPVPNPTPECPVEVPSAQTEVPPAQGEQSQIRSGRKTSSSVSVPPREPATDPSRNDATSPHPDPDSS